MKESNKNTKPLELLLIGAGLHLVVSRELTKMFEETKRGTAQEVLDYYTGKPPKGEIVIVVEGKQ